MRDYYNKRAEAQKSFRYVKNANLECICAVVRHFLRVFHLTVRMRELVYIETRRKVHGVV